MSVTITKFPYRHKNKKHQISIGIRLRFEGKNMEFPLRQIDGSDYKIRHTDYLNPNSTTNYLIEYWKELYRTAYVILESRGRDMTTITRQEIIREVKSIEHDRFKDKVNSVVGFESSYDNQDEVQKRVDESLEGEEYIDEDDYLYIYGMIQAEVDREQAQKDFLKRNTIRNSLERSSVEYANNGRNRTSIILSIGELHLIKKKNGEYLFPSQYRGILKDLYAFQFDEGQSDNSNSLTKRYFEDFLTYIYNAGVITSSVNATPYELFLGLKDDFFQKAERKIIRKETFKDKVKALNKTIDKLRMIIDFEFFEKLDYSEYLKSSVIDRVGSRKEEGLNTQELIRLLNYQTTNKDYRLSVDIFLIMVFAGGLRSYFPDQINFDREKRTITSFQEKIQIETENPVIKEFESVLDRYNWIPPIKPNSLNITKNLREVATELNLTRRIKYLNTRLDREKHHNTYFYEPLNDNISLRFARKSLPDYLKDKGLSREQIASFTGHVDPATLKYYVSDFDLDEKRRMISV